MRENNLYEPITACYKLISIKFYVFRQLLREFDGHVPEMSKFGVLRRREVF